MQKSDPDTYSISVAITAHREGLLAGLSIKSAIACIREAEKASLKSEIIVILDRADALTTRTIQSALVNEEATIIEVDLGDPALSRNRAVDQARGKYITFLDADDLWSVNWLVSAWRMLEDQSGTIGHSYCNIVFGDRSTVWWHADSKSEDFDPNYLSWANYWDAMSFALLDVHREHPYRPNRLELGFGHEDWFWNHQTLMSNYSHRPVMGTIHFKRARAGSQMADVRKHGDLTWPEVQKQLLERQILFGQA
jgi:glycosyltransferase involved in cell wall biosynthesis